MHWHGRFSYTWSHFINVHTQDRHSSSYAGASSGPGMGRPAPAGRGTPALMQPHAGKLRSFVPADNLWIALMFVDDATMP